MNELTFLIDAVTGELVVEGLSPPAAAVLAGDLLPTGREINCAKPLTSQPLPNVSEGNGPFLRVARIYHGSLVDGPGRRSVVQLQGCPIHCPSCFVPETHDPAGGISMSIGSIVRALLDPVGVPRGGITITGGEPFFQLVGLPPLLDALANRRVHVVTYTGYALESLLCRREPAVRQALSLIDVLVDGPFVKNLMSNAGEWRGSRNQRFIDKPEGALFAHLE